MFENWTEHARRAVLFARYEASQFGSTVIDTEHLLLGLVRANNSLARYALNNWSTSIRDVVERRTTIGDKVSVSIDLPLSVSCKRILSFANQESKGLGDSYTGLKHLWLGMLKEENCLAVQVLRECGLHMDEARERIVAISNDYPAELAEVHTQQGSRVERPSLYERVRSVIYRVRQAFSSW